MRFLNKSDYCWISRCLFPLFLGVVNYYIIYDPFLKVALANVPFAVIPGTFGTLPIKLADVMFLKHSESINYTHQRHRPYDLTIFDKIATQSYKLQMASG